MKYVDVFNYDYKNFPFQFFVGGRGVGKSYSSLKGSIEKNKKILYMRRTKEELESICDNPKTGEGGNPYKKLNSDLGYNFGLKMINKKYAGIYERDIVDDKLTHIGAPIGYGAALSTMAGLRSVDFSDVEIIIYDEFIPEKHIRKIKDEGEAFLNAYETITRNREFDGSDPVPFISLANANDIYNPIFIELGMVSKVEKMLRKGQRDMYDSDRGMAVHLLEASEEFKEAKKNTALYKLTKGSKFYDMAMNNDFSYNDFSLIGYKNLKGYVPLCCYNNAYLYKKKGSQEYHVSYAPARVPKYNVATEQGKRAFFSDFGIELKTLFTMSMLTFESYELKELTLDIIL